MVGTATKKFSSTWKFFVIKKETFIRVVRIRIEQNGETELQICQLGSDYGEKESSKKSNSVNSGAETQVENSSEKTVQRRLSAKPSKLNEENQAKNDTTDLERTTEFETPEKTKVETPERTDVENPEKADVENPDKTQSGDTPAKKPRKRIRRSDRTKGSKKRKGIKSKRAEGPSDTTGGESGGEAPTGGGGGAGNERIDEEPGNPPGSEADDEGMENATTKEPPDVRKLDQK